MIRYGIVGFGLHAVKRLMPGFAGAKDSRAVALSRRNLEQGRADAAHYNIEHVFNTTEELCKCPDVDVVFVTSPNALHYSDVLTAAKHGKAILCEKPMAMNLREAEEMTAAAKKAGVLMGIAQCFRFEPTVRRIRERVQRGDLGRVLSIRIDFMIPGTNSPRKWMHDAALAGGGPIPDLGVHTIDAMRFIIGDEPIEAFASTESDDLSRDVEATANINLRFARGAYGRSLVTFRSTYRSPIEVLGTEGSMYAYDGLTVDKPVIVEFRKEDMIEREEYFNGSIYTDQFDAFSAAFRGKTAFPIPAEEGVRNQKVLDACFRSAKSGRSEKIV
jgi:predicted dehydrogenase